MLSLLPTTETTYICPGETHAISRAVHLARLSAFYPKCAGCPHRQETGQLPQPQFSEESPMRPAGLGASLFTLEGVRGAYLNQLQRRTAGELAAAFASLLWEALPLSGRDDWRDDNSRRIVRRTGPLVVVGFDERPSSPDIVSGVAMALRRMSCQVVDVGSLSLPCFRFAVSHLQAAGGIFVSGHGAAASFTGLDFVMKHGRPISAARRRIGQDSDNEAARAISLDDIHERWQRGWDRPLRQSGTQRVFQASVPYLAGLWKHFHALRPLRVVCGCANQFVRQMLATLFEKIPVQLERIDLPQRPRDLTNADDSDVRVVRESVLKRVADFGVVIDDDGANVAIVDEVGQLLFPADLICLLAGQLAAEQPGRVVVIDNLARDLLPPRLAAMGLRCWLGGWTQSELWQAARHDDVLCGGGANGRVWLPETVPAVDAIRTFAQVLQALSRDDASLSTVVARNARV
jgi:phosphomannomutase